MDGRLDPQVTHRLRDLSVLVSLPQVTLRLMSLISNPNTSVKEVQEVLERDPALTAKIISLANSTYYSVRTPVKTVERAITIIGYQELGLLAMGLGLSETFNITTSPKGFDWESLWIHSLAVSWLSQRLAQRVGLAEIGEPMVAGLLHELGIIILVSKFPSQFQNLLDLILAGQSGLEAEKALRIRHELIGYELARQWKLPEVYQEVILYHHCPDKAPRYKQVVAMTALADALSHKLGFGLMTEVLEVDLAYYLEALGLSVLELQGFIKDTLLVANEVSPLWRQLLRFGEPSASKSRFSSLMKESEARKLGPA
jgi:HD-like signal output (HDOD) protein